MIAVRTDGVTYYLRPAFDNWESPRSLLGAVSVVYQDTRVAKAQYHGGMDKRRLYRAGQFERHRPVVC
jgi:hypothetical protein